MANLSYKNNVFINCPFDTRYKKIFDAIVFSVIDCGFVARSALELVNSGENRLERISKIIEACNFAIHDISRTQLDTKSKLPRFNMPFELGLYLGARRFGSGHQKRKNCIILDRDVHRYQKFISDIAGQDIGAHNNDPQRAITKVRDWLNSVSEKPDIPGGAHIWTRYEAFLKTLPLMAKELNIAPSEIQFKDRTRLISKWIDEYGTTR